MTLEPLTREDAEQVRIWRNLPEMQATLRTAKRLTYEEQQDWYTREIANRESHTRYWALVDYVEYDVNLIEWVSTWENYCRAKDSGLLSHPEGKRTLRGYGGIEHISWENRNGEMSLLVAPERQGKGLGSEAVAMFLEQAFFHLNLDTVYGECYACGNWHFWNDEVEKYDGEYTWLPRRKYYGGRYYESYYFTFTRENYESYLCDTCKGEVNTTAT